jgi:hypothetical protein
MADPESGKQSLGFSFDSLADELEGKESPGAAVKNLADNLFDVVYGNHAVSSQREEQADYSLFGRRLAQDVRVDFGDGAGKIHHLNGDLTVFTASSSFTQTTDQGGFFRVGPDENSQVIFHFRLDGEIDVIGPNFDDTLHLTVVDQSAKIWRNQAGNIEIKLDLVTGKTKVSVS